MEKIDCMTVEKLQLLVAGGLDRTKVKGLVLSGEAFPKFNQSERKSIWRILRRRGEIVPSLHTFFKDLSYLEVTASCLGRLVDLAALRKRTMRSAMKQIYDPTRHGRNRYQIQVSETEFRQCSGTVEEGRESGYRQLWLFAFRHYLQMPKARQKKKRHAKTKLQEANDGVVHRMASLALQLGFDSPQIQRLMDSPDRRLALAALLKARDRDHYRYDSIDTLVNQIVACFDEAVPIELGAPRASAPFSTIPRQSRCGKPSLETHEQEQKFLFLDQMESQPSDESVSALFVRRCVYFAFFGRPSETPPTPINEDDSTRHSSPHPPPSPLFVPEEHNPLDDHPGTGIVDHEIDRPDMQHRDRREERRERRQRRRQERETRRRQKQERRRQRESRRQQGMSSSGHEGGPVARSHSVDQRYAESSRGSSGNITEVEIDARNEHESMQLEEPGGNTLAAGHMPVDPLIAEPVETEAARGHEIRRGDTLDNTMVPEVVINDPEDSSRPRGFTEENTPGEIDENESLTRQEPDHRGELPSGHIEDLKSVLSALNQHRAVRRRSRPLGLKRTVISRQATAQARLGGKNHRLTQVDVQQGHRFTSHADLPIQSPLEGVIAEERAQTLAQLEESPVIVESAVADHADLPPTSPLPSVPEFLGRVREPESPVGESHEPTNMGDNPHETEIQGHIVTPEIIIHEPSPEHLPDHARLNTSTEANTPPREVANGEALIRQEEEDLLAELLSTLRSSKQHRAARRSRPLGLKRSAKAKQQAAQRHHAGKDHRLTQVDVKQGHQFTPVANLGAEELPPTEDLTGQSPPEAVVAEERAKALAQLAEPPAISDSAISDSAVADPASPPLPSMPELIARLRESESPLEGNHGGEIGHSSQEHPQEDLRQERSEQPSREAARPEVLTDDRETRRKVPEARRRLEAKQRVENTPRAAQELEKDFSQTQSWDDLFDNDDNGEPAPLDRNPAAAAGESPRRPSTSSPSQPRKRHARQRPYGRLIEKGPGDKDRPLTQINMQRTTSDQPAIAPGYPPLPAVPLTEPPPIENPANTLPVPTPPDGRVERRRKAANMIRERRPPAVTSRHERFNDLVIFRVWTGIRWTERARVVADPSDPLRCEREAKRFVEVYHAQLRDARLRTLTPSQCLQSARQDGSQSVFLIFPEDRTINTAMEQAAATFIGFSHR